MAATFIKKMVTKKLAKKLKEDFEIKLLRQKIETENNLLERYINVLAEYNFADTSTFNIFYQELFENCLKMTYQSIEKANLTEAQRNYLLGEVIFGKRGRTSKVEQLQKDLDYKKRLVSWAKTNLEQFDEDKKKKMVREAIRKQESWIAQTNKASRIYKQIEDFEMHNKIIRKNYPEKPKIKVSGSYKKNGTKRNSKKTKKNSGRK